MNIMESKLDMIDEKRCMLNDAEDTAEVALLIYNLAVREFNYLAFLVNWSRGYPL